MFLGPYVRLWPHEHKALTIASDAEGEVLYKFRYSHVTLIAERQSMEDQIGGAWMEEKIYEFIDVVDKG